MNYQIEVRDSDGDLVQVLENALNITLTEAINEPTQLSFTLPATDPKLHFITKANELWAREVDGDTIPAKTKLLIQEDIH